jgi:hypothetical protein
MANRLCPFRVTTETITVGNETYSEQHFMECVGNECMACFNMVRPPYNTLCRRMYVSEREERGMQ